MTYRNASHETHDTSRYRIFRSTDGRGKHLYNSHLRHGTLVLGRISMPGIEYVDEFRVHGILLKCSLLSEGREQPEIISVVGTVFPLPSFLAIWHVSLT